MNKIIVFFAFLFSWQSLAKERIVSASAFATEILFELNLEKELVGVDLTSVYPMQAKNLPQIGYKRSLTTEGILSLKPTVLIVDSSSGPQTVIDTVRSSGVKVLEIKEPKNTDDIKSEVLILEKYFNKTSYNIIQKIDDLTFQIKVSQSQKKPVIIFISRHGDVAEFASGRGMVQEEIIHLAGGVNAVTFSGTKSMNLEAMASLQADYIIYSTLESLSDEEKQKVRSKIGFTGKEVIFVQSIPLLSFGVASLEQILEISKQIQ